MKKNGKINLAIFSSGFALVILAKFSSDFTAKKPCTGETFSQCNVGGGMREGRKSRELGCVA